MRRYPELTTAIVGALGHDKVWVLSEDHFKSCKPKDIDDACKILADTWPQGGDKEPLMKDVLGWLKEANEALNKK